MKKASVLLILTTLSSYSIADADWCSYEKENREPNGNEIIFCPMQKTDIAYELALTELKDTVQSVKKQYPKFSKNYQKIEVNLLDVIEKHKSYLEAKCNFEGNNYIYDQYPGSKGADGDKYITVCQEAYKTEAIKKIREVVESCKTIDKEYELPCVY